jgi:lysophospholipase L1-like esterase
MAGSLVITLLALELVLRAVEPTSPPGTTYGRIVVENADGLRDHDFVVPKPPGTYRILVLGDSFTWGVGLNIEETIPKQLEAALRTSTPGPIEVVNASVPGMNTVNELAMLKETGLKYDPDMILLVYLLNDVDFKPELAPRSYNEAAATPVVQIDAGRDVTKWSKWKGVRGLVLQVEQVSALARYLVPRGGQLLHGMGLLNSVEFSWIAKVFQGFDDANPGWLESKRALREMAEIAREKQIPFVVAIYPLLVGLENYQGRLANRAVEQYARSIGAAEAIDLLPVFEGRNGRSFWVNYADHHPNAEAHRMVTAALLPVVRRYVPPAVATQ